MSDLDLDRINKILQSPAYQRKQFIDAAVLNIMVYFFFGGLFYWFSTSEARYESPDCETLRFFSYTFALVTLAMNIFQLFILLVACCTPGGVNDVKQIYNWVNSFQGVTALILLIFIYISMFKNEPCGDLRILVMTCFVLSLLLIFFICCVTTIVFVFIQ